MNHFTVFAAKELHLINQVVYFKHLLESCQKKRCHLNFTFAQEEIPAKFHILFAIYI